MCAQFKPQIVECLSATQHSFGINVTLRACSCVSKLQLHTLPTSDNDLCTHYQHVTMTCACKHNSNQQSKAHFQHRHSAELRHSPLPVQLKGVAPLFMYSTRRCGKLFRYLRVCSEQWRGDALRAVGMTCPSSGSTVQLAHAMPPSLHNLLRGAVRAAQHH